MLAGIAAVSAALLMTELALTRIFSVTMYYHFAFLAISIALFGLSASGVSVYVLRRRLAGIDTRDLLDGRRARARRRHAAGAGVSGPHPRRAQLLAGKPRADARDLRARGAPLLHRRRGHFARVRAPRRPHQRAVRGRPARRGGRLSRADSAAQPTRRAGRRADRGGALDRGRRSALPRRGHAREWPWRACSCSASPPALSWRARRRSMCPTPKATRAIGSSSASGTRSRGSRSTTARTATGR